jgi:site-specific DNA recombinase
MKPAAIYARVSTADQVKGTSLDGQVALCQEYAVEAGYTVIKVVQEDASGARLDRPKLGELRDMAERREIEAMIVYDPDRLSRSMAHTMMLMEEFERNRANVLFVNAPKEDTPEGDMLFGMRALFAQYERTKIMERTRRGKERRVREGQVMMTKRCLYGYEYIPAEKRIGVLEDEAVWVRAMFEWMVYEGASLRAITVRLAENGVLTKTGAKLWQPSVIREMLCNGAYAGEWHYGKRAAVEPKRHKVEHAKRSKSSRELKPRADWLSVTVPAIVPTELYGAVQEQLRHNQEASPRNSKHQYLLRGLAKCARCGYRMYGTKNTSGEWYYYKCPGRTQRTLYGGMEKRCDQPHIPLARLEGDIWDEVVRQLGDEKELRKRLEEIEAERRRGRKDVETELEVLANLEIGLKREEQALLDEALGGLFSREIIQGRVSIVHEKQAGIARSKAEVTARMAQWEAGPVSDEALKELCEIARLGLPAATFAEKRAFLEGMNVKITVDGRQVTIDGLITRRTLTIADKRQAEAELNDILCPNHQGGYDTIRQPSELNVPFRAVLSV